jgi:peptidyl-prolyl cis-trans isomerase A (cyclophilin A)
MIHWQTSLHHLPVRMLLSSLILHWIMLALQAQSQEAGLHAIFQTDQGQFTTELYFERAPRTVANFVSLAEGSRPWLDLDEGKIRQEPYYDGLGFHRIASGFVIQGGSPNGLGNDGPGYTFKDEFHPDLRHDSAGILSMANAGPNTNGSQFFITLAPTPFLDEVHSVFGRVVEGMEVVERLGNVPVVTHPLLGKTDTPIKAPMIQSITLERRGELANQFNPLKISPALPRIEAIESRIFRTAQGDIRVAWDPLLGAKEYFYASTDMQNWSSIILPPQGEVSLMSLMQSYPIIMAKLIRATADP